MLKRGRISELGIDNVCEDIFNDLKQLLFTNDKLLQYDEVISFVLFAYFILCNFADPFLVQSISLSGNMEKFKSNKFPSLTPAPKKRKKVLLRNGKPVTQLGVKEKKGKYAGATQSSVGSLKAGSSRGRSANKASPNKQFKKMSEAQQIKTVKKVSLQETKTGPMPNPESSGVFTPKFVSKDGQPVLNSNHPSLKPKTACNVMDSIFLDVEVIALGDKSITD